MDANGWISVGDRLPAPGVAVLMRYTNQLGNARTMIGHWQERFTVEAGEEYHEALELDFSDDDVGYEPGGWYEHSQWHPDWEYWHITESPRSLKITHWHAIPAMLDDVGAKGG